MAQMVGALVRVVRGVVFLLEEGEGAEDIFLGSLLRIWICRVNAGAAEVI